MRPLLLLLTLWATACVTVPKPRAAVLLPPSVWPRDTNIRWYDIEGDTEAELRTQLDAKGPEGHDAYTTWHVTTDVHINVTLPRWRGPVDENDALLRRWRRYLDALKEHESGHRETGFRAATDITQTLPTLPPLPTCEGADEAANGAARAARERYRPLDTDYDGLTRHGATQGAVFP